MMRKFAPARRTTATNRTPCTNSLGSRCCATTMTRSARSRRRFGTSSMARRSRSNESIPAGCRPAAHRSRPRGPSQWPRLRRPFDPCPSPPPTPMASGAPTIFATPVPATSAKPLPRASAGIDGIPGLFPNKVTFTFSGTPAQIVAASASIAQTRTIIRVSSISFYHDDVNPQQHAPVIGAIYTTVYLPKTSGAVAPLDATCPKPIIAVFPLMSR